MKNNNLKALLDADISGILATTNGTPPPPQTEPENVPFPLDILPTGAVDFIKSAEYANGIAPDFLASAILWATATAAGNSVRLELKKGTQYTPILFLCLVGVPNTNKSGALRLAMRPLFDTDIQTFEAYKIANTEFKAAEKMTKAERRQAGLVDIEKPFFSKIIYNDVTPEALAAAHSVRLRGVAVYRDELAAWFKTFDRYANGAEAETWLSLWSAAPLSIDRKTSEPAYIRRPFINVSGTLQPSILERLAADDRGQNGFLDRLLFSWPDNIKKPIWDKKGLDLSLLRDYTQAIENVLNLPFDDTEPQVITLTNDAWDIFINWMNGTNKALCDNAENELLQGLHGKMDVHAARLILALHLLNFGYSGSELPHEIDATTVEKGIRAAEYFRAQSLKVHFRIFGGDPLQRLPLNKQRCYDALPETFATADGVAISKKYGIKERAFKSWLNEKRYFSRERHGQYAKLL